MIGCHKQLKFRSFKYYKVDLFEQELLNSTFLNYQNYNDISEASDDFIQKIVNAIDKAAAIKERGVKENS